MSEGHQAMAIGDPKSDRLRRLFQDQYRQVRLFFIRRGFSADESRDLAQDTFLGACRSISEFRSKASLESWLLGIAANVLKNRLRQKSTFKRTGQEIDLESATHGLDLVTSVEDPLGEFLTKERHKKLLSVVQELPPRVNRCMQLRLERGLKYREIASVLQVGISTVKSSLHEGTKKLKRELGEQ